MNGHTQDNGWTRLIIAIALTMGCNIDDPRFDDDEAGSETEHIDPADASTGSDEANATDGIEGSSSPISVDGGESRADDGGSQGGGGSTTGNDLATGDGTAGGGSEMGSDPGSETDGETTSAEDVPCGDAIVSEDEVCDDGNRVTELACSDRGPCSVCASDCRQVIAIPASEPAISFGPEISAEIETFFDDVLGWRFVLGSNDAVVTELGFLDIGSNGLGEAHAVGIFAVASGLPVVTAEVPIGDAAPLERGFRYVPVTPTVLSAGETYVVLAYRETAADSALVFVSDFATPSLLTFQQPIGLNSTGGLVFTNNPTPDEDGFFGPTFRVVPASP